MAKHPTELPDCVRNRSKHLRGVLIQLILTQNKKGSWRGSVTPQARTELTAEAPPGSKGGLPSFSPTRPPPSPNPERASPYLAITLPAGSGYWRP